MCVQIAWRFCSLFGRSGWALTVCIPNKLLGAADTADHGPHFEKQKRRTKTKNFILPPYIWLLNNGTRTEKQKIKTTPPPKNHSKFWGNKTSEIIALVRETITQMIPFLSPHPHASFCISLSPVSFLNSDTWWYHHLPHHVQKKGPSHIEKTLSGKDGRQA